MLVSITHPVPVRWSVPRTDGTRLAFQAAVTSVEIPEVSRGTIRHTSSYSLKGHATGFAIHEGRCFERLAPFEPTGGGIHRWDAGRLLQGLADPGLRTALTPAGTPLYATLNPNSLDGTRGDDLPDAILSRAISDNTSAARAALVDYVRTSLVIDGDALYVARSMPVVHTDAWKTDFILDRHPATVAAGVGFEPSRLHLLPGYLDRMPGKYARGTLRNQVLRAAESLAAAFANLPYAGHDLHAFMNDGPDAVLRLAALTRSKSTERGGDPASCARQVVRLVPMADLGRIGAVPASAHGEVVDLVVSGIDALRASIPETYNPLLLRWLDAYAKAVARPLVNAAPGSLDADDAEALAGLGPDPA